MDKSEKERLAKMLHKGAMIERPKTEEKLLLVPHSMQSVYKLEIDRRTTEKFYSIRKMSSATRMADTTTRRRIKRNDIYHCKINDKIFFLEWQLLTHKAINLKQENIDLYIIKFDKGEHVTPVICDYFLCVKDAMKTIEEVLDNYGMLEIEKKNKDINELILENNNYKKPEPGITHEYLISPYCWAKYELLSSLLSYGEYRGNITGQKEISHDDFKNIKENLMLMGNQWTHCDLSENLA